MSGMELVGIAARFSFAEHDSVQLGLERGVGHGFDATSSLVSRGNGNFPSHEVRESTGKVEAALAEALARQILLVCQQSWFHHYPQRHRWYDDAYSFRWEIRVEQEGRPAQCWEGFDRVPPGMPALYDALTAFGMYRLGGFSSYTADEERGPDACASLSSTQDRFEHILCYERMFDEVLKAEGDPGEQGILLIDDFCDDITRYLEYFLPEEDKKLRMRRLPWRKELATLYASDVSAASRHEMLKLFATLVQLDDPQAALTEFVNNGTFGRWCERLRRIPGDEYDARQKEHRQERLLQTQRVDEAIRKRMREKSTFTSYDVASECNVTAKRASVRIRAFVRKGDLRALEGDLPRQYQAAA